MDRRRGRVARRARARCARPAHATSLAVIAACAALLTLGGALAQPEKAPPPDAPTPKAPTPEAPKSKPDTSIDLTKLPPEVVLGLRVESVRRRLPVAGTLVLVPDAAAFLDAIARWTIEARFPILIDDHTDAGRERIARFVRAFKPTEVLRWSGDGAHDLAAAESLDEREKMLADIAAQTWGAADRASLFARWRELRFAPPGVVVASLYDRAWPAAVALAAGRGEPIFWLRTPPRGTLGAVMSQADVDALVGAIEGGLDAASILWRGVGDVIDAVTLCMTIPVRIPGPDANPPGALALTDRIGRHADGARWAWTGLIPGAEEESLWRAMSALFLVPTSAWLANGYRDRPGYNEYDIAPAAARLTEAGLSVVTTPEATIAGWRARARTGVTTGFIHVNTSDGARAFNLTDGLDSASDTPMLWEPTIVHFIHSFSAANLDDRRTLGRMWLDRGAYVYIGSVREPFLLAFQTPGALVQRWLAPTPLAIAASKNTGHAWRVLYLGDPLITIGPPAPVAAAPTLEGAERVDALMRDALRAGDLQTGLRLLTLLGRDGDAARLVRAILDSQPDRMTPGIARLGWRPLLRTGQTPALLSLVDFMDPPTRDDPLFVDMLWLALRPALEAGDAGAIATLSVRLRAGTFGQDAVDLADAVARTRGAAAARRFLSAMRERAPDDRARKKIDAALTR